MSEPIDQTLAGLVVLVTADRRSAELAAALGRRGAAIRHAPALSMVPHTDDATLLAGTRALLADPPDTVVVTTGIGFRGWIEAADAAGLDEPLVEMLRGTRIVARGPKARGAIQAAGLTADWVAESETNAEIAQVLLDEGVAGRDIAVQHHGAGADGLDEAFAAAGARVRSLVVYRWGPPPDPNLVAGSVRGVAAGEIDAVVFTSAPGAHAWLQAAGEAGVVEDIAALVRGGSVVMAAVGPITAKPLQERGIEPIVPERGRLGALVRAVVGHYAGLQALQTVAGPLQVHRGTAVLDGRVLPLTPTGLEVLRLLAAAGGSVVPRDRVLAVLPGDSRDPHAAEVAIARLRDASGSRELIRTVVKRGYRLELEAR
ncbi:uroporphyrinogen-III synthase [Cellulomonas fengjieae]|uniref:Uroporphyrinogen-III synthase n=1 Tax=Cellulomonas fengjieae TaxID=2819978 RepID=A0ABS3SDF9_9CELL|nr:uroporphyrinogen-III synthase [Cellulomonas fengjieae]MBO3083791.1 uroporphyrinogen-III synthase [Cellulomonas fengjieae]MBO3101460.1 uroporphyrinogen-III synthase [Cellulomonas fengjieae]QVI64919.1 uroporphyrinogen-III synthase [Cellulomonas fengjieae]